MGIAPYKTFIFDGESSIDYGVYLTGEGVFNAPERAVEMITIPNRNGAYALDQGRFENIEITYHAGMVDVNESNFAQKVEAFRNWLCSKVGYCRLEDDYNPNEYRMAIYKAGIEVDHTFLIAGEFDITFECKPQRWITSGETATAITSGDTVTNPTLFDASPLITLDGYGDITVGSDVITVRNFEIGAVDLFSNIQQSNTIPPTQPTSTQNLISLSCDFEPSFFDVGDAVYVRNPQFSIVTAPVASSVPSSVSIVQNSSTFTDDEYTAEIYNNGMSNTITIPLIQLVFGTSASYNSSYTATMVISGITTTVNMTLQMSYDGSGTVTFLFSADHIWRLYTIAQGNSGTADGISTLSANSNLHIDLDIGEAYTVINDLMISANTAVLFPLSLPTLPSGATTITYDNSITNFKIASRWWKL